MRTRIRLEQRLANALNLNTILVKITIGSIALSCVMFFVAFAFNNLGILNDTVAGDKNKSYPFDPSSATLKKVNFTVLDPQINSNFSEVRPVISANGKELFFCRRNHPENISKKKDAQDIWVTTLQENGQWAAPQNLGVRVNSEKADAICGVSPDGSEIVFVHEEMDVEKPLMKAKRLENGWSDAESISIQDFYSNSGYVDFYYSYEANVLLMAVSRNDTRGEQDLYISFQLEKNKWSSPRNLGPVVNSFDADFAPYLAADGKTLYFASYGHKGLGGCDIFRTTRLDDSWTKWSRPENLGEGINSKREESYFSLSSDYTHIFFESYDPKNEVRDIFRADLPSKFKPQQLGDIAIKNN